MFKQNEYLKSSVQNQVIKVKNKVSSQNSKYIKKVSSQTNIIYIYYYLVYNSIYLKSIEKSTLYCDDTFLGKMKTK